MRTVAAIYIKDEGKALRGAALIKREKPDGVEMKFEKYDRRGMYRILLQAENGRELVVQQFVRDTAPNIDGFDKFDFSCK